jgi:hypothetical protein
MRTQHDLQRQRRRDLFGAVLVDALAALLSWVLFMAVASSFGGGIGWIALGAVLPPFALAAAYARWRGPSLSWVIAFAFPCIVVEWPCLYYVTLLILGAPKE